MTTTSPQTGRKQQIASNWTGSISLRKAGIILLLLAVLLTITSYILQASLNYPAILVERVSFANSLIAQGRIVIPVGFAGLLICGALLILVSIGLAYHAQGRTLRVIFAGGGAAGTLWGAGALLGLVLVALWSSPGSTGADVVQVLATIVLVLTEIIAPLLLVFWTMAVARQFRAHRVLALVSVLGLLLVTLRSLIWVLNTLLPIESGFYATAGIVNILALPGTSLWLVWLFLLGFLLLRRREEKAAAMQDGPGGEQQQNERHVTRRSLLRFGVGLGATVVGGAFVLARSGLTLASTPPLESDDVPSEPSFVGTLIYLLILIYEGYLNPTSTVAQSRANPQSNMPLPPGVSLENVSASGVPAQFIRAAGVAKNRVILYLHGGGFAVSANDTHRVYVAGLSQATGASVLLPIYRLAPEHPFPAGLQDCVAAYRWLRSQGIAASQIALVGESAGGNLVLATALALRDRGEDLPAALVAISPATDLTMSGESYQSKAVVDPVLGKGLPKSAYAAYTDNGAIDARNPLVSPLYADVHGLPPTLLQVGTQEVLLSDSTRMAQRLKAAGVETKLEVWPGMWHAFPLVGVNLPLPEASLATTHIVKHLRQHMQA